jgi:hypothetical protein
VATRARQQLLNWELSVSMRRYCGVHSLTVVIVTISLFVLSSHTQQAGAKDIPGYPVKSSVAQDAIQAGLVPLPTEVSRMAIRRSAREAITKEDYSLARQQYLALLSLPHAELQDTRVAIKHFEAQEDWQALGTAYQAEAKAMWRITHLPAEAFLRPAPKDKTETETRGPYVMVQTALDGQWTRGKGGRQNRQNWIDWIRRKQKRLILKRIDVLKKLGILCMDRLNDPSRAVKTHQAAGRGVPICTEPLDILIPQIWPVMKVEADDILALNHVGAAHFRLESLQYLARAQVAAGKLRDAADTHIRAMLTALVGGNGDWNAHGPTQEAEKFWHIVRHLPMDQPLPPTLWLNVLDPQQPEMTFAAPEDGPHGYPISFPGPRLVIQPGHTAQTLTVVAEMETPDPNGGRGGLRCFTKIKGKVHDLGHVQWHRDGRQGRQWREATFNVPKDAGIIRLAITPYNGTNFHIHNINVNATFTTNESSPSDAATQASGQANFDRLKVNISGMWIGAGQFNVTGNGRVDYSTNTATGTSETYSTVFKLRPEHLKKLNGLLKNTGWLTRPGANVQPGYTDASRIEMTLTREGKTNSVWCHDQTPAPYGAMIRFIRQIHRQEALLKRITVGTAGERLSVAHEIENELAIINNKPVAVGAIRILDFHRFVPACIEIISNTRQLHILHINQQDQNNGILY